MSDRPILFSGAMVRALLAGTKTQTRRIVKPRKCPNTGCELACCEIAGERGEHLYRLCPYGAPGDRLWVRETHALENRYRNVWCKYAADGHHAVVPAPELVTIARPGMRPSIHMPRWASRITLEIAAVRVERLQDISEADAIAEGVQPMPSPLAVNTWWQGYKDFDGELIYQQFEGDEPPDWMIEPKKMKPLTHLNRSAVDMYRALWIQLHGVESWDANPWVWVLEFRRVGT